MPLVAMAEASLAAEAIARPHYDRHLVVVHVGTDDTGEPNGHLHLGPALPDNLRRFMTCDAKARAQHDMGTKPLSVGRSARIVPNRTRLAIEERDGGCRVPGCDRTRWLHVHHIQHWEDGGATDTSNLMAPIPPTERPPMGNWVHPSGERINDECVVFSPPPGATAKAAAAALANPARDYPPY